MAAYLLAFSKIKDPARAAEYSSQAGPTVIAAGGSVVTKGKIALLEGTLNADTTLVVRFPDAATLERWHQSSDYQALIPLRDQAIDATFVVVSDAS